MNRLAVPLRLYSQSKRSSWPGAAGIGWRISPMSCVGLSSKQTTGRIGLASTCGMHHMSLRHGFRSFSAKRRRTVSRERLTCSVRLTIASANSSSVQRARPCGGLEQAVATSRASSLPESLRPAPGRGCSLSAASRLPSTKRCLVRYTVEPPTATLVAISSSLARGQQNLRSLELARGMLASAHNRGEFGALGLAQFNPIAYIHPCLLCIRGTDEQLNRMADVSRAAKSFTPKQGQYLAFIHLYTRLH